MDPHLSSFVYLAELMRAQQLAAAANQLYSSSASVLVPGGVPPAAGQPTLSRPTDSLSGQRDPATSYPDNRLSNSSNCNAFMQLPTSIDHLYSSFYGIPPYLASQHPLPGRIHQQTSPPYPVSHGTPITATLTSALSYGDSLSSGGQLSRPLSRKEPTMRPTNTAANTEPAAAKPVSVTVSTVSRKSSNSSRASKHTVENILQEADRNSSDSEKEMSQDHSLNVDNISDLEGLVHTLANRSDNPSLLSSFDTQKDPATTQTAVSSTTGNLASSSTTSVTVSHSTVQSTVSAVYCSISDSGSDSGQANQLVTAESSSAGTATVSVNQADAGEVSCSVASNNAGEGEDTRASTQSNSKCANNMPAASTANLLVQDVTLCENDAVSSQGSPPALSTPASSVCCNPLTLAANLTSSAQRSASSTVPQERFVAEAAQQAALRASSDPELQQLLSKPGTFPGPESLSGYRPPIPLNYAHGLVNPFAPNFAIDQLSALKLLQSLVNHAPGATVLPEHLISSSQQSGLTAGEKSSVSATDTHCVSGISPIQDSTSTAISVSADEPPALVKYNSDQQLPSAHLSCQRPDRPPVDDANGDQCLCCPPRRRHSGVSRCSATAAGLAAGPAEDNDNLCVVEDSSLAATKESCKRKLFTQNDKSSKAGPVDISSDNAKARRIEVLQEMQSQMSARFGLSNSSCRRNQRETLFAKLAEFQLAVLKAANAEPIDFRCQYNKRNNNAANADKRKKPRAPYGSRKRETQQKTRQINCSAGIHINSKACAKGASGCSGHPTTSRGHACHNRLLPVCTQPGTSTVPHRGRPPKSRKHHSGPRQSRNAASAPPPPLDPPAPAAQPVSLSSSSTENKPIPADLSIYRENGRPQSTGNLGLPDITWFGRAPGYAPGFDDSERPQSYKLLALDVDATRQYGDLDLDGTGAENEEALISNRESATSSFNQPGLIAQSAAILDPDVVTAAASLLALNPRSASGCMGAPVSMNPSVMQISPIPSTRALSAVRSTNSESLEHNSPRHETMLQLMNCIHNTSKSSLPSSPNRSQLQLQPSQQLGVIACPASLPLMAAQGTDLSGTGTGNSRVERSHHFSEPGPFPTEHDAAPAIKDNTLFESVANRDLSPSGASELDIRLKILDIQQQYRQKQRLLNRLSGRRASSAQVSPASDVKPFPESTTKSSASRSLSDNIRPAELSKPTGENSFNTSLPVMNSVGLLTTVCNKRKRQHSASSAVVTTNREPSRQFVANAPAENCHLVAGNLKDGLRVLVQRDGLFYSGRLTEVSPPDIYGVIMDKNRPTHPEIFSREQLLCEALREICPKSRSEIPPGTRVCAYWSEKFSCLYPGSVGEPDNDTHTVAQSELICIEFDDGDSNWVGLRNIRLLPCDFPVIAYEKISSPLKELMGVRHKRIKARLSQSLIVDSQSSGPTLICDEGFDFPNRLSVSSYEDDESRLSGRDCKPFNKTLGPIHCHIPSTDLGYESGNLSNETKQSCPSDPPVNGFHNVGAGSRDSPHCGGELEATTRDNDDVFLIGETADTKKNCAARPSFTKLSVANAAGSAQNCNRLGGNVNGLDTPVPQATVGLPAAVLGAWVWTDGRTTHLKRSKRVLHQSARCGNLTLQVGDDIQMVPQAGGDQTSSLPFVGQIASMWETRSGVKGLRVRWYYHPSETLGGRKLKNLQGALYLSTHCDDNDIRSVARKIEVLTWIEFRKRKLLAAQHGRSLEENVYYLAGTYNPVKGKIEYAKDVR